MDILKKLGLGHQNDKHASEGLAATPQIGEVVLEDGRFASVFRAKFGHIVFATDPNANMHSAKLICLCTLIDGKKVTLDEVLNISLKDATAIVEIIMANL